MESRYSLVCFDIDGVLCPTGREVTAEQITLMDLTEPEFRLVDKSGFAYKPFPGVVETLEKLKGKTRLAIISSGYGFRQRNKLILTNLEGFFSLVYISEEHAGRMFGVYDEVKLKSIEKPSPSMFQRMNWETRTSPERCVYIGNTEIDYLAARNAGWDFIGIMDEDEKYREELKRIPAPQKLVKQHEFQKILEHILR